MRFVSAEEVYRALDFPRLIAALREAHLSDVETDSVTMQRVVTSERGASQATSFLTLPAWRQGGAMGVKIATIFPDNALRDDGAPAVQAIVVLIDGANGAPLAVIDGTALTYRKTAADSGLGAAYLARADAETMLMVGAGGLAEPVIGAHLAARPSISEVMIWNRTPERAVARAAALDFPRVAVSAVEDLEAAARRADVISCATNATAPLILGDWLKPGAHLDLIGGFTAEMRECDDEAVRICSVYGDGRTRLLGDAGEIIGAIARGVITEADIRGDLYDLARGAAPGRTSPEERTLFKNVGGGHLDLMTAEHLMRVLASGGG